MWSSLSLRQFAEVTILPDSPQQWNCEFSLEALTFLLCFDPSPLEACLPLRYPCPCHKKKEASHIPGQGTAVFGSTDKVELHTVCLSYLSPVHQLFPSTGNLWLWRNLFPYLLIHICNMPRYLNVSSASWIPFLLQLVYDKSFWPCQCFLNSQDLPPYASTAHQRPRCDRCLYATPSARANLPGPVPLKNGHSDAHTSLNSKLSLCSTEVSTLSNSTPLLLEANSSQAMLFQINLPARV